MDDIDLARTMSGQEAGPSNFQGDATVYISTEQAGAVEGGAAAPKGNSLEELGAQLAFEKVLTTSDGNGQGRIVIPKAQAEMHLPHLENQLGVDVPAEDTFGSSHMLKFRYWINNQSRMYLLEGTQEIQKRYHMRVGDVITFAKTQDGKLVVSGRRATKDDVVRKPPVRSGQPNTKALEAARERKRRQTGSTAQPMGRKGAAPAEPVFLQPPLDGVFRAIPDGLTGDEEGKVVMQHGSWTATLNVAGELYQAYFETQEAAAEAFNAAGGRVQAYTAMY
ncbi:hypothetical protein WJX72_011881 [[Myrmecia] bisecta]|uniref:TF-B3 domain-containing protein n=1 Tax=[Myrmecia] bisecta TaxID=41462 RepID=A0AAW1PL30_9CHLO